MKPETLIAAQAEKIAELENRVSLLIRGGSGIRKAYILKSSKYEDLLGQVHDLQYITDGDYYGLVPTKQDLEDIIQGIKY